ncbi:unnamed protein product [Notodromas monacha]|uniref:Ankyrin repeat domain-containing protein 16 n=1 Tax=Notodromas monacha TaxID=399045 RepID=A0A7R9BP27_9CRUS|nr:unnamed protein product [Notodromas monacha]CAG0917970.1 unnamed protein product [Notodromas monacha]
MDFHRLAEIGDVRQLANQLNSTCDDDEIQWRHHLDHQDKDGKTLLHICAQYGHVDCAEFLVSRGAEVNCLKRNEWTPVMLACAKTSPGHRAIVRFLVNEAGADVWLRNKDGWTCFHVACRSGNLDVVSFLLDKYPEIWDTRGNTGRTPLHSAAMAGHLEVVRRLLSTSSSSSGGGTANAAAVNAKDSSGTPPVFDALRGGHVDVARLLVSAGGDLDARDALGQSVLHAACQAGQVDSVAFLLREADVVGRGMLNAQTAKFRLTALHLAAKERFPRVVGLLMDAGADDSVEDFRGRRPALV